MDNARVVVFEDRDKEALLLQWNLEDHGHSVVAHARTLEEAIEVIGSMSVGNLVADVVVLDANLKRQNSNGEDAQYIWSSIRDAGIIVPIIGFSAEEMGEYGVSVDFDAQKDVREVVGYINGLPMPTDEPPR